jgi:hypothetical protein
MPIDLRRYVAYMCATICLMFSVEGGVIYLVANGRQSRSALAI